VVIVMLQRVIRRIKRALSSKQKAPASLSQREMVLTLSTISHWEYKINFTKIFNYDESHGIWVQPSYASKQRTQPALTAPLYRKINYGCGENIIDGWLNIDLHDSTAQGYMRVNLLEKHPFEDNSVLFGFSEDMLEHLNQAESIFFLSEIYRTLAPGGVVRLSFPGLEGVLQKHYTPPTEKRVREGEFEAYSFWDHIHFYSREELRTVAAHLGFKTINFFDYGKSDYPELSNRDTREHQIGLNTHAELIK
jgi:predicted SAM-dependent methyltransferase